MTDTIISSATKEVVIGFHRPFVIIGERINPTGRKILAAEMAAGDYSRVISDALAQVQAGAHMLDVNAGIPLAGESSDYNGSQIAAMLGEFLDIPSISIIKKLEVEANQATIVREIEGGKEHLTVSFPFVASCAEGVAEPKIPNMRGIMSARTKPLEVIESIEVAQLITFKS